MVAGVSGAYEKLAGLVSLILGVKRAATFPPAVRQPALYPRTVRCIANQLHFTVDLLGCGLMTTGAKSDKCGEQQSPVNQ